MADENENETTDDEAVEETPVDAVAEEPEAEPTEDAAVEDVEPAPDVAAEAAAAEEPAPEPEAEEAPAEEAAPAEEPVAEAPAEEPAAEAEGDAPAAEAEAPAEEAAPAPQSGPKPKRKHVPRSQRRQRPKVVREKPAQRKPIVRLPKPEGDRGRRQERRGVVVSSAMDKTIVVMVETIKAHRKYKKVVRRSTKFHAHDEANTAGVGDTVRIVETRPLSKTKNWRLAEVLEKAK
jgi:small subunit ribosomal protein S17